MTEDQKKNLETQLWGIANLLRGKISADEDMIHRKPQPKIQTNTDVNQ